MRHLKTARRTRRIPEVEHDRPARKGVEADGLALLEILVAERLEAERRGDIGAPPLGRITVAPTGGGKEHEDGGDEDGTWCVHGRCLKAVFCTRCRVTSKRKHITRFVREEHLQDLFADPFQSPVLGQRT